VLVKLDDHALDFVALVILVGCGLPGIVFKRFDREADLPSLISIILTLTCRPP
jgi:hypothetical protein